jgi:hypothetical protein
VADTLRIVTSHLSSPGQGSEPQKPKRWKWPKIDQGFAAIVAALIVAGATLFGGGTILGRSTAPDTSHSITVTPTVTVTRTVTASPKGRKSSGQTSTSPTASPTPTTWLDQLKVNGSGEVSPVGQHELLIKPADNSNIVTYVLNRKYKTLNLDIMPAVPTQPNEGATSIEVSLDGTPYPEDGGSYGPDTPESNLIIPVVNVETLTLSVSGSMQDVNLLVSGALIS